MLRFEVEVQCFSGDWGLESMRVWASGRDSAAG